MNFEWNGEKNKKLKEERGFSFEELVQSDFVKITPHPNRDNQVMIIFRMDGYIHVAPAVRMESGYFLKTAFKSRKHNK